MACLHFLYQRKLAYRHCTYYSNDHLGNHIACIVNHGIHKSEGISGKYFQYTLADCKICESRIGEEPFCPASIKYSA